MNTTIEIISSIGVASIIGGLIYIGKKLQILDDLKDSSLKIKHNLSVVTNYLIKYESEFSSTELQAMSPYQLTDIGKEFIKDIGFEGVFKDHKEEFFKCIDSENPKLKYDVEAAAIKCISLLYDQDYMSFLKVYLYNHPKRTIENTAPTLGVYVRDAYLSVHKEITE